MSQCRCGSELIAELTRTISLRELARRSDLSPTYLSQIANGKVVVSPGAYVRLAMLTTKEVMRTDSAPLHLPLGDEQ